jgi:hypothetical protein
MGLASSIRARGVGGTLELAWLRLTNRRRLPVRDLRREADLRQFDRRHGVDTAGFIFLDQLKIDSPNLQHGHHYGATTEALFADVMSSFEMELTGATFIDFGSGKGPALLYASEYPFRRIIGVEFSRELHDVATANLARYRSATQRCRKLEAVCADASTWPLPEGPWLLFFNSPFEIPLWEFVLANIAAAPKGQGPSYLVHSCYAVFPHVAEFVERRPELESVYKDDRFNVFRLAG